MADHKIKVTLDSNKVVHATPNQQHGYRKNTVQWTCKDGDLRIVFAESPFESGALILNNGPGGTTGEETIATPKFKYTAEVTTPGGQVFSKDPDLIIEDGGGSGGSGVTKKPPKKKTPKKTTPKRKAKK